MGGAVLDFGLIDGWLLLAMCGLHAVLNCLLRYKFGGIPMPGSTMAQTKEEDPKENKSLLADVLTYNLTASCYAVYTAYYGCVAWFGADGEAAAIGATAQARLYGHSELFQKMAVATATYEMYNTFAVMLYAEYRTAAFIGHHLTTFFLALFGV